MFRASTGTHRRSAVTGSDAEVFLFDYARFEDEVVPAVVDLVRTATIEAPWLAWLTASMPEQMSSLRQHRVDLKRHCTFLGPDLRYLDDSYGKQFCRSVTCPARDRCPLHDTSAGDATLIVEAAFQKAVNLRCLGPSQFLGRSMEPLHFLDVLKRLGVPTVGRLRERLDALALRGRTLGNTAGTSGEGIHGWLTVDETVELALYLDELPLPRYEPSFERMEALWSQRPESWELLSLSFLRTTAFIAADQGKGLLWGNDVSIESTQAYAATFERVRLRTVEGSRPG